MKKIGIALGGGGAKGLAHIPMLEVLDELGVRPHRISGTSIGAIIGSLYAAGISASQIRAEVELLTGLKDKGFADSLSNGTFLKWAEYIDFNWSGKGLLSAENFLNDLMSLIEHENIEELPCSMSVIAADFWKRDEVVIETGDLKTAIQASMALPGIFEPVVMGDRVLIDGGAVNPVPLSALTDCDIVIGINVMGNRTESEDLVPSLTEAIFNTFQIMQASILRQNAIYSSPDILISPDIVDIKMLEFYAADRVFEQAEPAKHMLKKELSELLL